MSDRPNEPQIAKGSERDEAAARMLDCVHSTVPAVQGRDGKVVGPWQIDTIYSKGQSGDNWLAERTLEQTGKESPMIRIRVDGWTYVDNINPSGEEILVMDPYGAHPVEKGSKEEQRVLKAVHSLNFDICPRK